MCREIKDLFDIRHIEAFEDSEDAHPLFRAEVYHDMEVDTIWLNLPDPKRMQRDSKTGVVFMNPFDMMALRRPTDYARYAAPARFGDHPDFKELPDYLIDMVATSDRDQDVTLALHQDGLLYVGEGSPWFSQEGLAVPLLSIVKDYSAHGDVVNPDMAEAVLKISAHDEELTLKDWDVA